MIIPWNTDAPLYHFPFATIGLIVVNTVIFVAMLAGEDPIPWLLEFGNGLQPYQWVSNVFMHADIAHLVGNMIFLWGFGLVIEGKLGWWKFLLVYVGLGAFESAVSQIYMGDEFGFALGASGAIYGLLAMALIWAPRNDMNCVGFFGFRFFRFDLSILAFVTLYVGWEVVTLWLNDFQMSSAMLHLAGALPGFAVAIAMLKLELVDCENWDVFAVLGGREGEARQAVPAPRQTAKIQKQRDDEHAATLTRFQNCLAQGQGGEALALQKKLVRLRDDWQPAQEQRLSMIKALHNEKLWTLSIRPMVDYLHNAADSAPRMRLRLAQILIVHEHRPGRALSVLQKIPPNVLSGDLQKTRLQLERQAEKMYEQGELELDQEDW